MLRKTKKRTLDRYLSLWPHVEMQEMHFADGESGAGRVGEGCLHANDIVGIIRDLGSIYKCNNIAIQNSKSLSNFQRQAFTTVLICCCFWSE